MRVVHETLEGPYRIEEDIALYGLIAGDAILCRGARLLLHGTIAGNLTVETGARAVLHGTVAGRITNDGGRIELFGSADAISNVSFSAITIIDPKAYVRTQPVQRTSP
ncbi:hypothetical protein [Sphingobium sp. CFD-2]|uniref:hypothetical protein n=1 Tax=Sphingobium sp. CFD-2 TaxID=2878542 RepID=UPI00214CDF21|nr:hypothetical protein [Sphingobium sp. CFD-2]